MLLSNISDFPEEEEIVFPSGTEFKVMSVTENVLFDEMKLIVIKI